MYMIYTCVKTAGLKTKPTADKGGGGVGDGIPKHLPTTIQLLFDGWPLSGN